MKDGLEGRTRNDDEGLREKTVVDLHLVIETRRFLELGAVTPTECDSYPPTQ